MGFKGVKIIYMKVCFRDGCQILYRLLIRSKFTCSEIRNSQLSNFYRLPVKIIFPVQKPLRLNSQLPNSIDCQFKFFSDRFFSFAETVSIEFATVKFYTFSVKIPRGSIFTCAETVAVETANLSAYVKLR